MLLLIIQLLTMAVLLGICVRLILDLLWLIDIESDYVDLDVLMSKDEESKTNVWSQLYGDESHVKYVNNGSLTDEAYLARFKDEELDG